MNEIDLADRLATVDARQLRALVAVAEERSFRSAARRLGYAQSAISHQVAALERALEARLVERPGGRHPVALTEAGEAVAGHARRLLAGIAGMAADVATLAAGERGVVRVGVFQTAAAFLLPEPLGRFHRARPDVELDLHEVDDPRELLLRLLRGDLDIAYGLPGQLGSDELEMRPLVDDRWMVLSPASSPLTARDEVPISMLDGLPMIAWELSTGAQADLEATLRRRGIAPRIVFRTNDNVALTRFVGAGIGHACVGELFGESVRDRDIVARPLRGPLAPRRIALFTARHRPIGAAASALVDEILRHHAA